MVKVALGALIVLLILRYSLAAYLATVNPELALRLDRDQPIALLALAERSISEVEQSARSMASERSTRLHDFAAPRALLAAPADATQQPEAATADRLGPEHAQHLAKARDMVVRAMRANPLSYRAATLLGAITELTAPGNASEAARPYYETAARLSPRASDAIYWLMRWNLERRNYVQAIEHADTLMRTTSRAGPAVLPILARLLEHPEASEPLTQLLISDPPWRDRLIEELPAHVSDARTPLTLLLALRQSARQPTTDTLRGYLNFLMTHQFHELAYYTWLQFLPADQLAATGFLFNGSFETKPSGLPFDWSFRSGRGTIIDFRPLPGQAAEQGLRIDFTDGRVDFGGVSQIVLLAPGAFLLTGRYRGDLEGKRGLRWRVSCIAPTAGMLAETPMHLGLVPAWREFELEFVIPDKGCEAQRIHLDLDARSSSEQLVRGTMWYDVIRLERHRRDPAER